MIRIIHHRGFTTEDTEVTEGRKRHLKLFHKSLVCVFLRALRVLWHMMTSVEDYWMPAAFANVRSTNFSAGGNGLSV